MMGTSTHSACAVDFMLTRIFDIHLHVYNAEGGQLSPRDLNGKDIGVSQLIEYCSMFHALSKEWTPA
ncbi:hypothetical protein EOS_24945 [Caballeronia mineralivorans PML1(12)]|uniref:Uncharacterized protein n=1 Tax=Caballeronia mineralivorans PML1(12) TaxID=908627 RepID=A0A0J1CT93_9BURK|nr:hypothetical protein [Caballeronia mineralivorans]KLU23511.1 hypothetical protein EOS_24945 [Caballeronia mineralivorans PML1(12)]